VCVPIDPTRARDFDPTTVPTVTELVDAIDAYDRQVLLLLLCCCCCVVCL
jgi:hypothetical protein